MSHPGEWIGRAVLLALAACVIWFVLQRLPFSPLPQTKSMLYDKGRYLGAPDTPVAGDTARTLSRRVGEQAF